MLDRRRELTGWVAAEWRLKAGAGLAMLAGFCACYFTLQRVHLRTPVTLPLTAVDRAIPFDPGWVWVYQSAYLLIAGIPWLFDARADVLRYVRAFTLTAAIGLTCFLFVPTIAPRPAVTPATGMFAVLTSYDGLVNAFPSLHVALLVVTLLAGRRVLTTSVVSSGRRRAIFAGTAAWALAAVYSTLATKQHYAVDVAAGAALGVLVNRWVGGRG